jgi:hypothetical protein
MRQDDIQRFLGGMFLLPISGGWEPEPIMFSLSMAPRSDEAVRSVTSSVRIEDEASVSLSVSSTPGIKAG